MTYAGPHPQFDPAQAGGQPQVVDQEPIGPQGSGKKAGVIVLSIVAALLLVGTGTFGALYLNEKQRSDSVSSQLADKEKVLTDSSKQLQDTKDELSKAEDAKVQAEKKNEALTACHDAAVALRDAGLAKDRDKGIQAAMTLMGACH